MICEFCNRTEFINERALRSHRSKCNLNPNAKQPTPLTIEQKNNLSQKYKEQAVRQYNQNPKICSVCSGTKPFNKRKRLTCSDSCRSKLQAANNVLRHKDPAFKSKKTAALKNTLKQKSCNEKRYSYKNDLRSQYKSVANYIRIYRMVCSHCNSKFLSHCRQKYCNEHADLYKANQRNRFLFTFNVYRYPGLFDLDLLAKYQWRCSKTNPNGVTRDHRVSVNEAIRNGYDPYYIKHPLNCELMLFNENNKKKHYSSITYAELMTEVDKWDEANAQGRS